MLVNGNLSLLGEIRGLKPARLATDPTGGDLSNGLIWVNSTDKALRWYDGTSTFTLATGDQLDGFLSLEGGTMTGPIVLSGDASQPLEAVTLQQLTAGLESVQGEITGAASTILTDDLATEVVVVSDANGKVAASTVTTVELGHLAGVTDGVQSQIDNKQDALGYDAVNKAGDALLGDLNFGGLYTLTGMRAPALPTDAARLIDLENMQAGLDFQADVLGVQLDDTLVPTADVLPDNQVRYVITDTTTLNAAFGTIAGLENGDIIQRDSEGDFFISYDVSEAGPGALAWDRGTTRFIRWNGTDWAEHGGLSGVTVSSGLEKEGNTIRVKFGAGIANLPEGSVGVAVRNEGGLQLVDPVTQEASTADDAVLAMRLRADHGLTVSSTGLGIANEGVDARAIAADALGNGLQGGNGTALSVKNGDASIIVDADGVKLADISGSYLALDALTAELLGQVTVPAPESAGAIANRGYVDTAITTVTDSVTELGSLVSGNQHVFDGTGSAAQSVYAIEHNMNNKFVSVAVYDETGNQIIPDNVQMTDANTVTVTLATAQIVQIVVQGLKVAA